MIKGGVLMNRKHHRIKNHKSGLKVFTSLMSVLSAAVLIAGILFTDGFMSLAQDDFAETGKFYKSIVIEKGDTLWDIAEEYITDDYHTVEEYVSVLKDMNNLSGDKILAGDTLVVAYNASFDDR